MCKLIGTITANTKVDFIEDDFMNELTQESNYKLILGDIEYTLTYDQAKNLFKKAEKKLFDETYEEVANERTALKLEIDRLKKEVYQSNHVREDLDDFDLVANL